MKIPLKQHHNEPTRLCIYTARDVDRLLCAVVDGLEEWQTCHPAMKLIAAALLEAGIKKPKEY